MSKLDRTNGPYNLAVQQRLPPTQRPEIQGEPKLQPRAKLAKLARFHELKCELAGPARGFFRGGRDFDAVRRMLCRMLAESWKNVTVGL